MCLPQLDIPATGVQKQEKNLGAQLWDIQFVLGVFCSSSVLIGLAEWSLLLFSKIAGTKMGKSGIRGDLELSSPVHFVTDSSFILWFQVRPKETEQVYLSLLCLLLFFETSLVFQLGRSFQSNHIKSAIRFVSDYFFLSQ